LNGSRTIRKTRSPGLAYFNRRAAPAMTAGWQ
jgi:hypothetical protein